MSRFHSLSRPARLVLRFLSALSFTATLLLLLVAALDLWPTGASAAPAAQGPAYDCETVSEIPKVECLALVSLYNNTDGPHWISNTGWLQNATPCDWFGVACSAGHVTRLGLPSNHLSGILPSALGNLTELTELRAYDNTLSGDIPDLSSCTELIAIYLDMNRFTGAIPAWVGSSTHLQDLSMSGNQLTGTIPVELGQLTTLTGLSLSKNRLTGSIPEEFGNLSNMRELYLEANQLTGTIPSSLGGLANLTHLYLGRNQLTGPIPSSLGDLMNLTELSLSNNRLSDPIPPSLGNIRSLTSLQLGYNQLTGTIPSELGALSNLEKLQLYGNKLSGSIPSELGNLTHLSHLHLGLNELTGTIPATFADLSNLTQLNLNYNRLSGSITNVIGLPKLAELDLSFNEFSGPIPPELGTQITLTALLLGASPFTGEIPDELGNLTNLSELQIFSTQLTGTIPSSLGNLRGLTKLGIYMNPGLSGPIPSWLTELTNLETLWLVSDHLTGTIPDLSGLTKLTNVRLDNNYLTGTIPNLRALTELTNLRLDDNYLTGEIPDLRNSTKLAELYLGANSLSGPIPQTLGALSKTLTILNLDNNRLSGPVPQELCELTNMMTTTLTLGYNALDLTPAPDCPKVLDPAWMQTQTVPPANIRATAVSTSSIRLTWTPIAYLADDGGYEVRYSTTSGNPESYVIAGTVVTKSASSYTLTDLAAATTYHLAVRTHTGPHGYQRNDLWSAYSQVVTATTQVPAGTLVTVKRESETGSAAPSAQLWVYRNDNRIAEVKTNIHGQYVFADLQAGDRLVALDLQHGQPEAKDLHDGWSYRVYLTSMDVAPNGTVTTTLITQPGQPLPPLVIKKTNPLILFNLLVSVESNVDLSALQALSDTLRQASDFLYDVTDGQFALGKVAIYDAAKESVNADMRVPAFQGGIPNALVGGIAPGGLFTYTSPADTIVYGPGFFRMTPDWPTRESSQVCGGYCKTLIHELAHYAFYLYDEYYRILPDGSRQQAHCTAPNLNPDRVDTNASIMDNQVHATSELAMRKGTEPWSQWSTDCEQTEQWLLHGESDWETLANAYSDVRDPQPRWIFKTPAMIEQVNPGPAFLPLWDLPRVDITDFPITNPIPSPMVTAVISGGAPCGAQCQVYSLKKMNGQPSVILGLGSPQDGRINVPGLQRGDELISITTDGAYFGSLPVTGPGQTLTLEPDGWNPQVTAQLAYHGITVTVTTTEALTGPLQAIRMDPGGAYSQTITLTEISQGVYAGTFDFDFNTSVREGYVWIWGTAANDRPLRTVTSYAVAGVPGSHEWAYLDLNSLEGTLHLVVPPGGVPTNTLVIAMPVRQLEAFTGQAQDATRVSTGTAQPGSGSSQSSLLTFVGTGYHLGATEGTAMGNITSTLTLFYGSDLDNGLERAALDIYHYNDAISKWEPKGGLIDRENRSVSASVHRFGIYALVKEFRAYLPIIVR